MGAKHLFLDSCLFCFLSPTRHPLPAEYSKITQSLLPWFLQPPFPPFLQLWVLRPLRDTDATDAGVWLIGASWLYIKGREKVSINSFYSR